MALRYLSFLGVILAGLIGPVAAQDFTFQPFNPIFERSAADQISELHAAVRGSLVFITATAETTDGDPRSSSETGAIITPEGHIITAYHILDRLSEKVELKKESIKFSGIISRAYGLAEPLTIVDGNRQRDLLLLRFLSPRPEKYPYLCIDSVPLKNSQQIFTSGFPKVPPYKVDSGKVLSLDGDNDTIVIDIPIDEGQSGSPVYLQSGRLVGIALGKVKNSDRSYSMIGVGDLKSLKSDLPTDCTGFVGTSGGQPLRHKVPPPPSKEHCANKTCPADMVLVPVAAPGGGAHCWCIDRYEASEGPGGVAASVAGAFPWERERASYAEEACKKAEKVLCPADVWVTACQGSSQSQYPYGNLYEARRCNDKSLAVGGPLLTGERVSCEGGYPGLFDMSGNRSEWTATGYRLFGGYYGSTPAELECGSFTVHCPVCSIGSAGFRCCRESQDATDAGLKRDQALLLGYEAAFTLARARMGNPTIQDQARVTERLRHLGLQAIAFPDNLLGVNNDAVPASDFAQKVVGTLEARDLRLQRAFLVGWLGVITINTPSLKPGGFNLRSFAKEAGFPDLPNLSDADYLEFLVDQAKSRVDGQPSAVRNANGVPEVTPKLDWRSDGSSLSPQKLILVLDSRTREASLGDVVRSLEPLEREGLIRIEETVLTADLDIVERLAAKKPALVLVHVHAFSDSATSIKDAHSRLLSILRSYYERNNKVRYIVYSGGFDPDSAGGSLWLARMIEQNTYRGGQLDGFYPPFLDRITTLGLPGKSPLPQEAREELRRLVRNSLSEAEDGTP
jgi:hypothetical protein